MLSLRRLSMMTGVVGVLALASAAHAQYTINYGATSIAAPSDIREDRVESDTNAFIFSEGVDVVLGANQNVNVNAQGSYFTDASLTGGFIAAGTRVDSFLIHTDPLDTNDGGLNDVRYTTSITFDQDILGLIVLDGLLNSSDSVLGNAGTTYTPNAARGLELDGVNNQGIARQDAIVSWSGKTLVLHHFTHGAVDQVRVVTKTRIPEPGTFALLGVGALGAMLIRRRK